MRPVTVRPLADRIAFVRANTAPAAPPLLPELRLHTATAVTPLWQATEEWLERQGLGPPFWAFPWAGGQAVARHVLDDPGLVRGRRVLDFAAGSGLIGIAAALAGAASVWAVDIDPLAEAACAANADLNGVALDIGTADIVGEDLADVDVLLVGDVCYERPMAERVTAWLRARAAAGTLVLLGDPGRAYLPTDGLERVAEHTVPTTRELEDREDRVTTVWRVAGTGP